MLDLELGNARALLFLRLILGQPTMPLVGDRPKLIQISIVARGDETAVRQHDRRLVGNRPIDQVDEAGLDEERRLKACKLRRQ